MNKKQTQAGEGFKLMAYQTKDGGTTEIFWNSRDGITPFGVHDRGGEEMFHINWRADVYAPFFVPPVGSRIFVDLTMEKAIEYRKDYVERYWKKKVYGRTLRDAARKYDGAAGKNDAELRELAVTQLAAADLESFEPHTPDVVVVTEEIQKQFAIRAREAGKSDEAQNPSSAYRRGLHGDAPLEVVR